jgi:cytochrome b6-f complex iron-sulfur subunit
MMERRKFIERILISSGTTFMLGAVFSSCEKDDDDPINIPSEGLVIDLTESANSNLLNPGGFIYRNGLIVANTGNEEFTALASTCTHEACTIGFSLQAARFPCPCHGSEFSYTGSVLTGPATIALQRFTVARDGDILTIS